MTHADWPHSIGCQYCQAWLVSSILQRSNRAVYILYLLYLLYGGWRWLRWWWCRAQGHVMAYVWYICETLIWSRGVDVYTAMKRLCVRWPCWAVTVTCLLACLLACCLLIYVDVLLFCGGFWLAVFVTDHAS